MAVGDEGRKGLRKRYLVDFVIPAQAGIQAFYSFSLAEGESAARGQLGWEWEF
jgi:hypothetical protein